MKQLSLGANGASVAIDLNGAESLAIQATGTFALTAQLEVSADGGANWFSLGGLPSSGAAVSTNFTAIGLWIANVRGYSQARVRVSAFTSGSAVVSMETK